MRTPNKVIQFDQKNKKNHAWRRQLPTFTNQTLFYDEHDKKIDTYYHEKFEQYLVYKWIKPNDIVLELGARYGIVSYTINKLLDKKYKRKHIVVEPDKYIIPILKNNRKKNNSKYKVCKKPISNNSLSFTSVKKNGLASFTESTNDESKKINITFDDFMKKYKHNFTAFIVDCEGCFYNFLLECPEEMIKNVELIIFEQDWPERCDYDEVKKILLKRGFTKVDKIYDDFQQVWIK